MLTYLPVDFHCAMSILQCQDHSTMAPPHNNTTGACGEFAKCAKIILQFKTDQSAEWVNSGVQVDRDQSSPTLA